MKDRLQTIPETRPQSPRADGIMIRSWVGVEDHLGLLVAILLIPHSIFDVWRALSASTSWLLTAMLLILWP